MIVAEIQFLIIFVSFVLLTSKISQFREDFLVLELVLVLVLEVWAWLTTDPLPAHDRIEK